MHHNTQEEFIGVDVGDKRIGIARGSGMARIAQPLKTIEAKDAVEEILELVKTSNADGIVVGLPRNLAGSETNQTASVRGWVDEARLKIKLPFYWQDEALTSKIAEEGSNKAGSDAVAASILLQDFLDTPKEERVRC